MHDYGVVHLDIKLENLLIDSIFNLKIADFGFVNALSNTETGRFTGTVGTPAYAPPEICEIDLFNNLCSLKQNSPASMTPEL